MKEIEVLSAGGTILYPTDTVWGLGCDATNPHAIEKVNRIKGRSDDKHFLILVSSLEMLSYYVEHLTPEIIPLLQNPNQPVTVIYPSVKHLPPELLAEDGSLGIRLPQCSWLQHLIENFGKPIVSTSANFSGAPTPNSFAMIDPKLSQKVDYVSLYRREETGNPKPSKIVKIADDGTHTIIRP